MGEALAGRAERIKAYSIATEVFGRDASFDPQSDPIVRVEAGHLRRALEQYYVGAGRQDPVEITIPKGAYVPVFVRRGLAETPVAPADPPPAPVRRIRPRAVAALSVLLVLALAGVPARPCAPTSRGCWSIPSTISRARAPRPPSRVA